LLVAFIAGSEKETRWQYTIPRVELRGSPTIEQYEKLHENMQAADFTRTIRGAAHAWTAQLIARSIRDLSRRQFASAIVLCECSLERANRNRTESPSGLHTRREVHLWACRDYVFSVRWQDAAASRASARNHHLNQECSSVRITNHQRADPIAWRV